MFKPWFATLLAASLLALHLSGVNVNPLIPAVAAAEAPAAVNPESGQGRAERAGRALLGMPAPPAVIRTIDGESIRLADLYGRKPVYLKFWASWCVPCREQMPGFERDFEKLGTSIAFVAVNAGFNDPEEGVRAFRRDFGLRMPVAIDDGTLARALNLRVTPLHVVIGRDGRILYVGHLDDAPLHAALEASLARAPAVAASGAALHPEAQPVYAPGDRPRQPATATTTDRAEVPIAGPYEDGRPRVLVFFSPWCESYLADSRPAMSAACRRAREATERLASENAGKPPAVLLAIASGLWASARDVDEYRHRTASPMPTVLDDDHRLFTAFDVHAVPTLIVLDPAGRIAHRIGPDAADPAAALRSALGEL